MEQLDSVAVCSGAAGQCGAVCSGAAGLFGADAAEGHDVSGGH